MSIERQLIVDSKLKAQRSKLNTEPMLISAIVAMSKNRVIGKDNGIPWYLPADMKYFKKTTMGHHVIMGRKTFLSIGRPLPKRTNIVLTRDPFFVATDVIVASSIKEAINYSLSAKEDEVFIIGGGEIYKQSMQQLDRIYLTQIDIEIEGEVFFPELNELEWKMLFEEPHQADEKNPHNYNFQIYERIAGAVSDE